jgi:hypothetical protein
VRLTTTLCAAMTALILLAPGMARADNYEVFIDIETEEDLYDLLANGEISEDTFNTLIAIYQRGIDINDASRDELYTLPNLTLNEVDKIVAYRDEAGWISDPAVLSVNGIISDAKLLAIAPFLRIRQRTLGAYAVDGMIRTQTRWSSEDDDVPPAVLQARVATLKHLSLGFAGLLNRTRLGDVAYDPNRNALSAEAPGTSLEPAKGYAMWRTDDVEAIVGTYRIGFGQSLTFDNTSHTLPNGIRPDDEITRGTDLTRVCKESRGELGATPCDDSVYTTPDFRYTERLFGAAAGLRQLPLGSGIVQVYGFGSSIAKGIYQYEIYDRAVCDDPTNDDDPNCSAPQVYKQQDDPLAPTSRFSFSTLPDLYRETLFGGNVTYFASPRMHIGVTGYGASVDWLTEGIDLDFQEWSRTPYGGGFGAIGMDFAWGGTEWLDIFGEVAQTIDSQGADDESSGGVGGVLRGVVTWNRNKNELETSVRAYGQDFANPYARPISAPDEYDGLRARDEIGGRIKFSGQPHDKLRLRTSADIWNTPSNEQTETLLYLRAEWDIDKRTRIGGWTQFQDKGLDDGGRDQCFEVSVEEDERGEPIPCSGQKWQWAAVTRIEPSRKWFASAQARIEMLDEARYSDKFRYDASGFVTVTVKPVDGIRLRSRTRYLFEDVSDNEFLEQSIWTYLEMAYTIPKKWRVRLRYDLFYRMDDRMSTAERSPNPENWLWLELEAKF